MIVVLDQSIGKWISRSKRPTQISATRPVLSVDKRGVVRKEPFVLYVHVTQLSIWCLLSATAISKGNSRIKLFDSKVPGWSVHERCRAASHPWRSALCTAATRLPESSECPWSRDGSHRFVTLCFTFCRQLTSVFRLSLHCQ